MRQASNPAHQGYRLAVALAALLALVALPACDSMLGQGGSVEERPTASAVRDPVLQDVPKPAGFMLVDDRSFAFSSGKIRIARCEYVGATDRSAVKQFYEEYMPSAGFDLRQWSLDNGMYNLRFESTGEVCTVRIHPKDWSTKGSTGLVVEIGPKPQGPTEHEAQPPMRRPE
jgi:hypothetical protein